MNARMVGVDVGMMGRGRGDGGCGRGNDGTWVGTGGGKAAPARCSIGVMSIDLVADFLVLLQVLQ